MPLYQYVCQGCQAEREILVRGSEEPVCPECGSSKLVKQLGVFNAMNGKSAKPASPCAMAGSCPNGGACGLS